MADGGNKWNGEVGYCRPPKHTQFQKGQSGNRRGRPPKPKPEPGESMLDEFFRLGDEEVEGVDKTTGQKQKIRRRTAVLRKLWHQGAQDAKTAFAILDLYHSQTVEGGQQAKLSTEDEAILQRLMNRLEAGNTAVADAVGYSPEPDSNNGGPSV